MRQVPYDVLLMDYHKLMRDGIRAILEREPEFRVVGEAESGADAVQWCKQAHPDLVIMDIGLPGVNSIEATTEILRHSPKTRVLIVAVYDDDNAVLSAIRSGARGFPLTRASAGDLIDALRNVAQGRSYLSSQLSARLLDRIQSGELQLRTGLAPVEKLSPREHQVLRLIADGKTSKDIAALLELGEQTVRSYRKTLMKKLGVNNVAGLTQMALSTGLTQWKPDQRSKQGRIFSNLGIRLSARVETKEGMCLGVSMACAL
jgi:DNA-binding NarL/FixJ family response regulator